MAGISITYEGPPVQRQVVKATAMAPLSSLLGEACAKMKPPLDPAHATLLYNKKPLTDLSCPFRLANIPNGSSLTLLYDKPATSPGAASERIQAAAGDPAAVVATAAQPSPLPHRPQQPPSEHLTATVSAASPATATDVQPAPSPPAAAAAANPPPCAPEVSAPADTAASVIPATAGATHVGVPELTSQQEQQLPISDMELLPIAAAAQPMDLDIVTAAPPQTIDLDIVTAAPPQTMDLDVAAAVPNTSVATTSTPLNHAGHDAAGSVATAAVVDGGAVANDSEADHLGLGRPSALFSREALEAALESMAAAGRWASGATGPSSGGEGGGAGETAEGEDFFEVTPEDLASMMRSNQLRRIQEEAAGFRTRAAREADERAKALSYSHVAIRAHLPGSLILQATFAATEAVGALRSAVLSVVSPSLAPAVYMYTTPPRQVLQPDQDHHSLYHVGLVPAAHVHVGLDEKKAAAAGHTAGASVLRPEMAPRIRSHIGPELAAFHGSLPAQASGEERKRQGRHKEDPGAAAGVRAGLAGGAASSGATTAGSGGGGAKVPKWLKLGSK